MKKKKILSIRECVAMVGYGFVMILPDGGRVNAVIATFDRNVGMTALSDSGDCLIGYDFSVPSHRRTDAQRTCAMIKNTGEYAAGACGQRCKSYDDGPSCIFA